MPGAETQTESGDEKKGQETERRVYGDTEEMRLWADEEWER